MNEWPGARCLSDVATLKPFFGRVTNIVQTDRNVDCGILSGAFHKPSE